MQISHVLRGEEWLPSAPIHQLVYDALGWETPAFVHLPVILDPSGKGKMSKRKPVVDGKEYPVFVEDFMQDGYLPEAMFNFLANIGWNFDAEQEIFTRDEAIARFELPTSTPLPALFPMRSWTGSTACTFVRLRPPNCRRSWHPFWRSRWAWTPTRWRTTSGLRCSCPLSRSASRRWPRPRPMVDWAFVDADAITYPDPNAFVAKKMTAAQTLEILRAGETTLRLVEPFEAPTIEAAFRALAEAAGVKLGAYFQPFRVAITGKAVSPPLFESMHVLGRAEVLARVRNGIAALERTETVED